MISYKFPTFFIILIYISCKALDRLSSNSHQLINKYFGHDTLLVIAHPDDETMFFGPTLFNIIDSNKSIVILSLSNGGANGLGRVREEEFANMTKALGSKVISYIEKSNRFPDTMIEPWDISQVGLAIVDFMRSQERKFQTVLTFDPYGVSGHMNHQSIHKSMTLVKNLINDDKLTFLVLKSVSLSRKYLSMLEATVKLTTNYLFGATKNSFSVTINLSQYWRLREVLKIHKSQMLWFRYLYMTFSRYMFINDLEIFQPTY